MNPTVLQTLQLMSSIATSEKMGDASRKMAQEVIDLLLPLVKGDAVKLSAQLIGIEL